MKGGVCKSGGGSTRSGDRWKVDAQTLLIFNNSEQTKRKMDGPTNGTMGRGIKQVVAHWVYVVQLKIYPEFPSPSKKEVLVNLHPF
jgi:hypothetical protein